MLALNRFRRCGLFGLVAVTAIIAALVGFTFESPLTVDDGEFSVQSLEVDLSPDEVRADINNRDSNIATCLAGFGFYSLTGYGLACAYVNDETDTFPGTPITTGGFGYTQFGFHQVWLNTLHNMGLQGW